MNKRNFLKTATILTTAVAATPTAVFGINKKLKSKEEALIGHGSFKYKVKKDWAKISAAHTPLLNCHEMVMDSKGRLIMIGDHTDNNILVFDKSGKLLTYWGTQYPGGHGLSISKEGEEDFLVITDCGYFQDKNGGWQRQSGQVFKTTIDGKLVFNFGHPHAIGVYKANERFQPTETTVAPNGDIYVGDGYGSDYIIQYDARGKYIRHFGGHHNSNPDHNLKNAHGVAIDNRDKNNPVLICTSRSEQCFKTFTLDGKYIKTIQLPGLYVCRAVIDDKNIYAGVCWSDSKETKKRESNSGFVTILDDDDKVVSNPGGTAPQYINGKLQPMFQAPEKIFNHGHDVCIDDDKNVYVCQWNANHTAPIKLERV